VQISQKHSPYRFYSGILFSSLIFGEYKDGNLIYVGHSGGGFNEKNMNILFKKLKPLETEKNPFSNKVDIKDKHKIHWIEPKLFAEIKTSNKKSPSGNIRHPPIFIRLREDKNSIEIRSEKGLPSDKPNIIKSAASKQEELITNKKLKPKKVTSEETIEVNGKKLILTNEEHHVWKNVTKAELFTYYHNIWPYLSPYLKERPLGLHSNPYGARALNNGSEI